MDRFYDPANPGKASAGAFNPGFLADLRNRRGERLQAFKAYQAKSDPDGMFLNGYVSALLGA